MDTAYLHIITNHIPIIGVPFAAALLVLGIWRKSDDLKSAALLSFFALGLVVILVYLTGEPAEELVENVQGVAENAIDDHEDFAFYALGSVLATAAVSGIAFLLFKGWRIFLRGKNEEGGSTYPVWLAPAVLVLALISSGVLGYTGKLGGMIRHTEFYGAAPAAEADDGDEAEEREEADDDESGRGRGRNRGGDG